jgi:hypothetical protein
MGKLKKSGVLKLKKKKKPTKTAARVKPRL